MEIQKDIPGYEGLYSANTLGEIFSLTYPTLVGRKFRKIPYKLKQRSCRGNNYYSVTLTDKDGFAKTKFTHCLIAETFIGNRPNELMDCCHNDGDPSNNTLQNLRWDTKSNNQKDRLVHDTDVRGIKHPKGKLTDEQVITIFEKIDSGVLKKDLAKEYGVSKALISALNTGHLRKWLKRA